MLAALTLITAMLYGALVAYFQAPAVVVYLGIGVGAAGLLLVAGQSLRLFHYTRLSRAWWMDPKASTCNPRALADSWSTAALWMAFGALLLFVGLIIEGLFLFLVFPAPA